MQEDAAEWSQQVLNERYPELCPDGLVSVVNFARMTRGFLELCNSDRITLIRSSCIDIIVCIVFYCMLYT